MFPPITNSDLHARRPHIHTAIMPQRNKTLWHTLLIVEYTGSDGAGGIENNANRTEIAQIAALGVLSALLGAHPNPPYRAAAEILPRPGSLRTNLHSQPHIRCRTSEDTCESDRMTRLRGDVNSTAVTGSPTRSLTGQAFDGQALPSDTLVVPFVCRSWSVGDISTSDISKSQSDRAPTSMSLCMEHSALTRSQFRFLGPNWVCYVVKTFELAYVASPKSQPLYGALPSSRLSTLCLRDSLRGGSEGCWMHEQCLRCVTQARRLS